jgi:hypothetical protein
MSFTAITEKQANEARIQHSEFLRKGGVHAISVDEIEHKGSKTYAVIAMTEKKSTDLPKDLEIKSGKVIVKVPLIVKTTPKFKLE